MNFETSPSFSLADLSGLQIGLQRLVGAYDSFAAGLTMRDGDLFLPGSAASMDVSNGAPADLINELSVSVGLKVAGSLEMNEMLASLAAAASRQEPSPYFVPFSVARSAIEATTVACWLLEYGLEPRMRVARQLTVEWQETLNQERLGATDLASAKVEMRQRASELNLELVGHGTRAGFGRGAPTRTELSEGQLGPEAYRILSAASHGETWATYVIGFTPVEAAAGGGARFAEKSQPVSVYMLPILWAFRSLAHCFWSDVRYRGAATDDARSLLEDTYDTAGIGSGQRFWRTS